MEQERDCIICGRKRVEYQRKAEKSSSFYMCPVCGRYELIDMPTERLNKNKAASFLYYNGYSCSYNPVEYRYYTTLPKEKCEEYQKEFRSGNNIKGYPIHLDNEIVEAWYPHTFSDKIDMILLQFNKKANRIGSELNLSRAEWLSCMFAERYELDENGQYVLLDDSEANRQAFYISTFLYDSGYVKGAVVLHGDEYIGPLSLTPKGYGRIDELQKQQLHGQEVLVAMQFGDDTLKLREAIREGISLAGYRAIFIDEVQHNDYITPELLKYIKNSRFVVADLTHKNNGAYFEEGYAMGLGKQVIQLCQKDVGLHFDIAQKNTIMWKNEMDIPELLEKRIRATID